MVEPQQLRTIRDSGLFERGKNKHVEGGQSFVKWRLQCFWQRVFHRRLHQRVLCLQPVGELRVTAESSGGSLSINILDNLKRVLEAFFLGLTVEVLPPLMLNDLKCEKRIHRRTNRVQWLVTDLLMHLKRVRPRRALCIIGMTMEDLYPSDEWNFVLGHAMYTTGCAVISAGRYASDNPKEAVTVIRLTDLMWRLARVITHEACHLFGIGHCHQYVCSMNESVTVFEAESQPLVLCPLCLQKLQHVLRFQLQERYFFLKSVCYQLSQLYGNACITSETVNSITDIPVAEPRATNIVHEKPSAMEISFSEGKFEATCQWLNTVIAKLTRHEDL